MKRIELNWDWMLDDVDSITVTHPGLRLVIGFLAGLICLFAIGMPLDLLTSLPDAAWLVLAEILPVAYVFFGGRLPRLHYAYGLGWEEKQAIEWYRSLSKDEKKQLPQGWEDVIRESGTEYISREPLDKHSYLVHKVTSELFSHAKEVIKLYREKQAEPKVLDYRVGVHLELMKDKADALRQEIKDRKDIEDKIKDMS